MNCSGEKGKSFFVISFPGLHKLQLLYPFQCTAFLGEPLCNFFFHSCFTTQRSNKFNTQLPRSLLFMLPSDSATLHGSPCKDHYVPLSLVTNALWFLGVPKGRCWNHTGVSSCTSAGLELHRRRQEWGDLKEFIWQLKGKSSLIFPQHKCVLRHEPFPRWYFHLYVGTSAAKSSVMGMVHFLLECFGVSSSEPCFLWSFQ